MTNLELNSTGARNCWRFPVRRHSTGDPANRCCNRPATFNSGARGSIAGIAGFTLLLVLRRPIPPSSLWREVFLGGLCRTVIGFPMLTALAMVSVPTRTVAWSRYCPNLPPPQPLWRMNGRARASGSSALGCGDRDRLCVESERSANVCTRRLVSVRYRIGGRIRLCTFRSPEPEHTRLGGDFVAGRSLPALYGNRDFGILAARLINHTAERLGRPCLCEPGQPVFRFFLYLTRQWP